VIDESFNFNKTFPCYYYKYAGGSNKVVIFFHGNGEDLGLWVDTYDETAKYFKAHVIAVEYPAYGVCFEEKRDAFEIKKRALSTYMYLKESFGIMESNIIVYGRSIGTGPACYLASKTNPSMVLLNSPFSSIKNVALSISKSYYIPSIFISERFNSLRCVRDIKCPVFIAHGKNDDILLVQESEILMAEMDRRNVQYKSNIVPGRGHNDMDVVREVILPCLEFWKELGIPEAKKDESKSINEFKLKEHISILQL
jgi:pimeloyl-ACP methyl ester carboxylesterase